MSCEVDIYGALSEYIGTLRHAATAVTLLDINNTVPADMYEAGHRGQIPPTSYTDTFMGFHCGNTAILPPQASRTMKYQLHHEALPGAGRRARHHPRHPGGRHRARRRSPSSACRATADSKLQAYVAQGEVLPVATRSFGGIGVFAIPEMKRFYRHVLIAKHYPHHGAVGFGARGQGPL